MEKYNEKIKIYYLEYLKFMKILSKAIELAKENNYEDDISIDISNKKNLLKTFLFFACVKEKFLGNSLEDNINYNLISNFDEDSIQNVDLFFYWQNYLIISFIDQLIILLAEKHDTNTKNYSSCGLNKILALFHHNNNIIYNLYQNRKIDFEQIISFLNIHLFWIKTMKLLCLI